MLAMRAPMRAKARRRALAGAVVGIAAIVFGALIYYVSAREHEAAVRAAAMTTWNYEKGMLALKSGDFDTAKKIFDFTEHAGDARGNFGIACVLYQTEPNINWFSDGPVGAKRDVAIKQLEYAASHGVYMAQAALIGYYQAGNRGRTEPLIVNLVKAARDGTLEAIDDAALPAKIGGKIADNPVAYVSKMLRQGFCAPALSPELTESLIDSAVFGPIDSL
jgi:hypothetical protein